MFPQPSRDKMRQKSVEILGLRKHSSHFLMLECVIVGFSFKFRSHKREKTLKPLSKIFGLSVHPSMSPIDDVSIMQESRKLLILPKSVESHHRCPSHGRTWVSKWRSCWMGTLVGERGYCLPVRSLWVYFLWLLRHLHHYLYWKYRWNSSFVRLFHELIMYKMCKISRRINWFWGLFTNPIVDTVQYV